MQQTAERIEADSFEIVSLNYPPHDMSPTEADAQELSSNGLAVKREANTKLESAAGSPIKHIYNVIPTKRGFMAEALLSGEEELNHQRVQNVPRALKLTTHGKKRVLLDFAVDDLNLSRLRLAPSHRNPKKCLTRHCAGVEKS